jgi:hypothetical protein
MESAENYSTVFRPSHKTLKIDETDSHIPTATTTTEQFFHLKPEKPVQTIGATSHAPNFDRFAFSQRRGCSGGDALCR